MNNMGRICGIITLVFFLSIYVRTAPLLEDQTNVPQHNITNDPEYGDEYFEGDIILAHHRTGLRNPVMRWPNKIVYFRIDRAFDRVLHEQILLAMMRIERATCIRFAAAGWQTPGYVYISGRSAGCSSEIGYRGGVQLLNLQIGSPGTGCFKFGTILHELMHTLGVVHQQSAPERDEYVKIITENIRETNLANFEKNTPFEVSNFGVPYDYYSIMHYSSYAFSKNGRMTIVAKRDPNIVLGQRSDMTASDILKLNRMYNCP